MKKKLIASILIAMLAVSMAACGKSTDNHTAETPASEGAAPEELSGNVSAVPEESSDNVSAAPEESSDNISAAPEESSDTASKTNDEIRRRNHETIHAFMEDAVGDLADFYAEDGVKSLPFFPPEGAYWKGIENITANSDSNGEQFAGFTYSYINIHDTSDPNIFWVEAAGSTDTADLGGDSGSYSTEYIDYFSFDDEGKLLEFREYFSPINLFVPLGIEVPDMEMPPYSVGKSEIELPEVPDTAELSSEEKDEIRKRNRDTIHAFMEDAVGDLADFYAENGVKSLPFFPPEGAYWQGIENITANSDSNGEQFAGFTYSYINIHDTSDPNIFWVEAAGSTDSADLGGDSGSYTTEYIDYFSFDADGKILEFREYFSPVNLFVPLGIEVPDMEMPPYSVKKSEM